MQNKIVGNVKQNIFGNAKQNCWQCKTKLLAKQNKIARNAKQNWSQCENGINSRPNSLRSRAYIYGTVCDNNSIFDSNNLANNYQLIFFIEITDIYYFYDLFICFLPYVLSFLWQKYSSNIQLLHILWKSVIIIEITKITLLKMRQQTN